MFYYQVYGLTLQVNQPLEGLIPASPNALVNVSLELLGQQRPNAPYDTQVTWVTVADNQVESNRSIIYAADLPDGRYIRLRYTGNDDRGGWHEYVIDPSGSRVWAGWAPPRQDMVAFLLGPVLAAVLGLRGHTCLHASVVAIGTRCIALLGAKGAGKSTTAATFSKLGYTVLSDDVARLVEHDSGFLVWPGYPRLRLRPDAATAVVGGVDDLARVFEEGPTAPDKRYLELTQCGKSFPQSPYELEAIYLLEPREKRLQVPFITPVAVPTRLITLVPHTSMNMVRTKAQRGREFITLARLARLMPLRRVYRADSLSTLPQLCQLIVNDVYSETNEATLPNTTLADMLPNLLRDLPAELAQDAACALLPLKEAARYLPPIASGGVECRLDGNPQIDLQQCIIANESQLALLHTSWRASVAQHAPADPVWARLLAFVAQWRDRSSPSSLKAGLSEMWLEFDSDTLAGTMPLPALFFGLPQEPSMATSERLALSEAALELLLESAFESELREQVQRCFTACQNDVFVSHIGVMLSRPTEAVRVNIKRLQPDTVGAYLTQIGWEGDTDAVVALMEKLAAYVDRITVCLDVGRTIASRVGLECILLEQPPAPAAMRWATLLDRLVTWGLCLPEKQAALLRWPGRTLTSDDGSVVRRLSHVKVDYRPNQALQAKGYLWFHHEWGRP